MRVGLIDVDGHNFPNLALMKLSAWHKAAGDRVEFAIPLDRYDRVYASKVFTFSPDIDIEPMAGEFYKGGTGYGLDNRLPDCIEHMRPDYSLYGITDTAYGFLSRGCPRGCPFCIVAEKEGRASRKVADLAEWWNGQRNIKILDPNLTACAECLDLMGQLAESKATVDFTQGLDVRLMDDRKIEAVKRINTKRIHFAWDGLDDLEPRFRAIADAMPGMIRGHRLSVYVLTNFNTDRDWNLHRIYTLRDLGFDPFVMVYDRDKAPADILRLQRWCNNKIVFKRVSRFEDYEKVVGPGAGVGLQPDLFDTQL